MATTSSGTRGRRMVHSRTLGSECLVHDARWRGSYQHILNATRGIHLPAKYIPKINKLVCNCKGGRMDEDFMNLHSKELECSKENIKALKTSFSKNQFVGPLKEINDFIKDILAGPFTEEHTSKYRLLLIIEKAARCDFSLIGGEKEVDISKYAVERMINFSANEAIVDELIEDRAAKLREVVAVVNLEQSKDKVTEEALAAKVATKDDVVSTNEIQIEKVKRSKKDKEIKFVKAVLYSVDVKQSEEAFAKLTKWLAENYEVKLNGDKVPEIEAEDENKETSGYRCIIS